MIKAVGLEIFDSRSITISQEQAEQLYAKHEGRDYYPWLIKQILSGRAWIFLVRGESAARTIRELAGPTKPEIARIEAPHSIRALLTPPGERFDISREEKRAVNNVVHTSDSDEEGAVQREGRIFFPEYFPEPLAVA